MKKLLFKKINYFTEISKSIYSINIEDQEIYRYIGYNIIDNIVYSENNKIYDMEKYSLVVYDCFHINLNEKRLINSLYKSLENNFDDQCAKYQSEIEQNIFKLFDQLSYNSNISISYLDSVDISKLFSIYGISFPEIDTSNYIELILNYFKLYSHFLKIKIIVCFGLLSILTEKEASLLENELNYLDITLVDISFRKNESQEYDLTIDSDWCII